MLQFGHKESNCKENIVNIYPKKNHGPTYRNTNQFEVLIQDIKCFSCHNFAHKDRHYKHKDMATHRDKNKSQTTTKPWKQKMVW